MISVTHEKSVGGFSGIAVMGNIIIDNVKDIDCFPECGMMAYITKCDKAIGGCVPNTAINLSKIDNTIPVIALGCVGSDENGHFAVDELQKNGVQTDGIVCIEGVSTSFCDVMSLPGSERTFFHCKGANAMFSPDNVDIDMLNTSVLHAGYILLMDEFDRFDETYGTVMAGFLKKVQQKGIKTSVDVVSDSTADYASKIIPVLKYCNYFIVNEIECCNTWGIDPYPDGNTLNVDGVKKAMQMCAGAGVCEKVVVHSRSISFILDCETGIITSLSSLKIPSELVKGSVGAGDAFCAGCLYGLYNGFTDLQILEFATASAACSLFAANSTDAMKNKTEIYKLADKYGRI